MTASHRAAAVNLLCAAIQKCVASPEQGVRSLIWEDGVWMRCFEVFLMQHNSAKPKFMRQLLVTLAAILSRTEQADVRHGIHDRLLERLLRLLLDPTGHSPVKPAMQALTHFLAKDILPFSALQSTFCGLKDAEDHRSGSSSLEEILNMLLHWAVFEDLAPTVGQLLPVLLDKAQQDDLARSGERHEQGASSSPVAPWIRPVLAQISGKPELLECFRYYIFPSIFKRGLRDFCCFLGYLGLDQTFGTAKEKAMQPSPAPPMLTEDVLFCALSVGKEAGLVLEVDGRQHKTLHMSDTTLYLPDTLLGKLLSQKSANARLSGLSLLISSTSAIKPLTPGSLRVLKQHLPHLHAETDAGFRSELFTMTKRLIERLRAATATLAKHNKRANASDIAAELNLHRSFVSWYLSFLRMELRPTASYQRHISSLKCLTIVLRSGLDPFVSETHYSKSAGGEIRWPFQISVADPGTVQTLIGLLLDPFDDVRLTSAGVLKIVNSSTASFDGSTQTAATDYQPMLRALTRAERSMMTSGRADHADGVAHVYAILFQRSSMETQSDKEWWFSKTKVLDHLVTKIENTTRIASDDLLTAVNGNPLHGLFSSVRWVLTTRYPT